MDHNKIIDLAAKKAFIPLGLKRQGRSRFWYDDRGWWAIIVEFQPSSWGRGSYLNVGVSWLLYESSAWGFDIGYREQGFQAANQEEQFEAAMADLAKSAASRVLEYRKRFRSVADMYAHYRSLEHRQGWPDYYAGVLAGLNGDMQSAAQHFSSIIAAPAEYTWERVLQYRSEDLMRLLQEPMSFRDSVLGIVLRCRCNRNLKEMPVEEIALP